MVSFSVDDRVYIVRFFIKHNSLWTYTNAQSHPIAKWS